MTQREGYFDIKGQYISPEHPMYYTFKAEKTAWYLLGSLLFIFIALSIATIIYGGTF